MRAEISKLHQRLQTTFIYVTHDQIEAMTMGTRIVVMKDGVVQQIADPQTIYQHPSNMFVASFIGAPQMNFIDCQIVDDKSKLYVKFDENKLEIPEDKAELLREQGYINKDVVLGIRPEGIFVLENNSEDGFITKVDVIEMLGSETYLYLTSNSNNIIARVEPNSNVKVGNDLRIIFDNSKIHIFDKETEKAIF